MLLNALLQQEKVVRTHNASKRMCRRVRLRSGC